MALLLGTGIASAQTVSAQAQVIPVVGDITEVLGAGSYGPGSLGLAATGDIVIDGADAVLTATGLTGLSAVADGSVAATVLDVTTTGGSSPAILIDALDVDLVTGGLVSTTGDDSAAVSITSDGPVTVNSALLQTAGVDSNGVEIVSLSGPVLLDADIIDTTGDRSLGALIQAAGDIDANIGLLRTDGAEAAGVELTTDPAACVVLGTGACDINGTFGDIATGGLLAPGALVRAAGDIGLDVGVLRTEGDEAVGLDLATSPTACATLGPGGCDTAFSVGDLQTLGLGSTGALVRATGLTTANIGILRTAGDNAIGLDLAADPAACILLGSGACDTVLNANEISTAGDGSPGALIRAGGPVTARIGQLETLGLASPGLDIATDPLVCATLGAAACSVTADIDDGSTEGDDSDVVGVDNDGPTDVDVENGSTSGDGSSVVDVDGGAGPVTVDVENGSTSGANSPVIDVETTTGDQTIDVGTVVATGPGSDAIEADSDTGDIDITVREQASSADGAAIDAATGGTIDVDILAGAEVSGDEVAIDIDAGGGSTINNAGTISADDGLAINADGGATLINNSGAIIGRVDLTPNNDIFNNSGDFDASGTSDFGAGTDVFNNTGRVRVRGPVALASLETFNNAGLIDMRDDAADDSLTVPGSFNGQAGSELAIDVDLSATGTPADRLIVGGAVTGTTVLTVNNIGGPAGVLNPDGVVIVDAGSAAAGAFVLDTPVSAGFVDYTLETDAGGDIELVGRPGQSVFDLASVGALSQAGWYRSGDLVSDHGWRLRAAAVGPDQAHGWQVWGQASTSQRSRENLRTFDAFGVSTTADAGYDQHAVGAQFGADTLRPMANGQAYGGVTFGFDNAEADLGALSELDIDGVNIGVYGGWFGERAWIDGMVKADSFDLQMANRQAGYVAETSGKSYGAEVKAGYRFGDADFFVEPLVSLAYVRTSIDGLGVAGAGLDFDDGKSMRGKAGVRIGRANGDLRPYAMLEAVKEFEGDNAVTFSSGGFSTIVADNAGDAYGLVTVGVERPLDNGGLFAQAQGAFGEVEGYGLRIGARARW